MLFGLKKEKHKTILYLFGIKFSKNNRCKKLENQFNLLSEENFKLRNELDLLNKEFLKLKNDLGKFVKDTKSDNTVFKREKNLLKWNYNYLIEKLGLEDLKDLIFKQKFMYEGNTYIPNINSPKTFNEKILWLKKNVYANNPLVTRIVDKITFKDFVKEKLGEGYTIPLLKVWETVEDINYDELPEQFVLKSNWGGNATQVFIVKDKSKINKEELNWKLREWVAPWYGIYYYSFNDVYKNIKPKIFAEKYIKELEEIDSDYKFFCFNGDPAIFYRANNHSSNRNNKEISYYNLNCEKLELKYDHYKPNSQILTEKPEKFEEMLEVSKKLSADFPFVRVDLYSYKNKLYVGEITFTPGGGFGCYSPVEWDYKLGEMLNLNDLSYKMNEKIEE